MEYASGIASAARRVVDAARAVNPAVVVACTRKTFPGTKPVAIKSILAGGATPHRLGLSETILVFPEHRAFLGDRSLSDIVADLHAHAPEKKIVVEVLSLDEAQAAIAAGADVIQLEKFPLDQIRALVALPRPAGVRLAAAGGVNAKNAADFAAAGAEILVTSAPYSAPPVDIKVTIEAIG
jgi:molybdenum transport protein